MRGALGLGLGLKLTGRGNIVLDPDTQTFIDRVLADGGTVEDPAFLNSFVLDAKANNYFDDIIAAYSPSWGVKGGATASDLYSVTGATWDLAQPVGASQPAIVTGDLNGKTRLLFDGIQTSFDPKVFTYSQPETVINGGFEQESWTNNAGIFDGIAAGSMLLIQGVSTPDLRLFAGTALNPANNEATIGTSRHVRSLFNTTASAIQVDGNAEIVGNPGAANAGGFTYGEAPGGTFGNFSDGMKILLNSTVDGGYAAKMTAIYNFSKSAYGTA